MQKVILFLDPRGTATEVVKAAKAAGWRTTALVSHPDLASAECRAALDLIADAPDWNDIPAVKTAADQFLRGAERVGVYFSMDACATAGNLLRQEHRLPHIAPDAMALVIDKRRLRQFLRQKGLSQLGSLDMEQAEALTSWPFKGAAYFKPVHGVVSAFVTKVSTIAELRDAARSFRDDAHKDPDYVRRYLDRDGRRYHLEESCEGELLSLESLASGGRMQKMGLLSRILYSRNHIIEMGSCFPYPHPKAALIAEKLSAIHQAVGFTEGPAHTELIITRDDQVELIDFNPRIVGADVLWSINFALGIELQKQLLAWAVGENVAIDTEIKGYSCLQYVLPPQALTFASLALPSGSEVRYQKCFVAAGTKVESVERQTDYLGCYLTFMPTFAAAVARSGQLRADVKVNGEWPGSF